MGDYSSYKRVIHFGETLIPSFNILVIAISTNLLIGISVSFDNFFNISCVSGFNNEKTEKTKKTEKTEKI